MSLGDTPLGCVVDAGVGRIFGVVRCSSVRSRIGAGMGSRVELYAAIRFDWQRNQMSIRALADKYGVHRRTVREAVASPVPPPRNSPPRPTVVLDSVRESIDAMLVEDLAAPRKQRHTATRICERLRAEHDARVSYSYVAKYVHRRRPQVVAQAAAREAARAGVVAGFVPQCHPPGAEAEVDFADLWVRLDGEMTKCFLFTLRLSHSGRAVHRVFASQGQEAFLEGHVAAFEVFNGIPFDKIRYDNLRSAVHRVLFGRNRAESGRWLGFRAHYGFDAFYCVPGVEGAHEKGGVEGDGGRFRRTHLVPVPQVATLAELNARLVAADLAEDARHIDGRAVSVGAAFAVEAPLLRPLPGERFDTALSVTARVDRYAQIMVRQVRYSVPARLIGSRVRVALSPRSLRCSTARRGSRPIPGCCPAATRSSSWITTWRSCWASPVRCRGRPRWPRPARPGRSPRPTRRSGPLPAPGMVTPPAPGR
jgi:transposase